MKVLVACEESQAVTKELRRLGHEAYSCDIIECSGGHPEWHIQGNCLPLLNGDCGFWTCDKDKVAEWHELKGPWDMIIAHPPCTYLSNAGAARLFRRIEGKSYCDVDRLKKGLDAREFFYRILSSNTPRLAIENPIPSGIYRLPKYSQVIQPYEFGHPYSKKTCLWLKNLPNLIPTEIVEPICSWVSGGSKKADGTPRENKGTRFRDSSTRSKTFPGIARAMAEQWAGDITGGNNDEP